jgi:4-amino-4-deoxy-L-arabinose transferase-like glycosyltransferase
VLTAFSATILVGLWLLRWPLRSRFPYEWDSASYILGARHFDVYRHHPHPPGYPLYVLILKGMRFFTADLNAAQVVVAFAFTGAATIGMYRLARRWYGASAAVFAAALLLFSPPVVLYNAVASTYPIDLLTSVLLGGLAARLWTGEKDVGHWAVFALAALAGFRESGAVFLTPLVGIALARAYRADVVRWCQSAVLGAVVAASWYVPTAMMHGGVIAYQRHCNATIHGYFAQLSVLYGAPKATHLAMLYNAVHWSVLALIPAVLASLGLRAAGRAANGAREPAPRARQLPDPAAFYALWMGPNVLYVTLLQCVKPGYLLLSIPPAMLLLTRLVASSFDAIGARLHLSNLTVASVAACILGSASTALACHHFHNASFQRSSLASVWEGDEETRAVRALMEGSHADPDHTMAIYLSWPWYGPTPQSLQLQYPGAPVAILSPGSMNIFRNGAVLEERGEAESIPLDVQRMLWICDSCRQLPASIVSSFPTTSEVYSGRKTTAFLTEIGGAAVDARGVYESVPFRLVRSITP